MIVVVAVVRGVPVTVMQVVDVVTVRHRHMSTPVTVSVLGMLVHDVPGGLALVPVALVTSVQMAVVDVVDVVTVRNDHVPTPLAVNMLVS